MGDIDIQEAIISKFRFRGRRDNLPWSSPRGNRSDLAELFCELGFILGAEIGTRVGMYSKILCEKNPNLKLLCVDPWMAYGRLDQTRQDQFYQDALVNLRGLNVKIIRKTSMDALKDVRDKTLDFVFIDGNHEFDYVCPDLIFWARKVRRGGIISLHDYYNFYRSGVVHAVDAYTRAHHIDPWFVTRERDPVAFWVNP